MYDHMSLSNFVIFFSCLSHLFPLFFQCLSQVFYAYSHFFISLLQSDHILPLVLPLKILWAVGVYYNGGQQIELMLKGEGSLYGSSVHSYSNLQAIKQPTNFVKYLHSQQKLPAESPRTPRDHPQLLPRNKSYDALTSRWMDVPSAPALPTRFYESIENSSSHHRMNNQTGNLQAEITRLMAQEVGLKTEKELLGRESRRLKEQVEYLSEKCSNLQAKNEELFRSQSKMAILEREYSRLQVEYEQFKSHCRIMHDPQHFSNQPTRLQPAYDPEDDPVRLRSRDPSSRINPQSTRFSNKVNQKVSWKRTGAVISPINKLDGRKFSGNKFDELSLIESKIDRCREEDMQGEAGRTVDLKQMERIKSLQERVRTLQSEIKQLRGRNMQLLKRSEHFQQQKLKFLEGVDELNYEKSKLQSQHRAKENQLRREAERIKLELEDCKIKVMELNERITNLTQTNRLALLQKAELEERVKKTANRNEKEGRQMQEQSKDITKLKDIIEKSQKQSIVMKQRCTVLSKRQEELQLQNKLHLHQIQQRNARIIELEVQIQRLKDQQSAQNRALLEEESLLSKTENKIQIKPQQQQREQSTKTRSIQTDADSNRTAEQLTSLKETHQRLLNQHGVWSFQLNKLRNQNVFLNENYLKLTSLYEAARGDHQKMKELAAGWREIEGRMRGMKSMDATVDHLWQVKQAEYGNLHSVLQRLSTLE